MLKRSDGESHFRVLGGMSEAIGIMEARIAQGTTSLGEASLTQGNQEWYGTETLGQAVELAKYGWREGREKVVAAMGAVSTRDLVGKRATPLVEYGYSGDEPDIDRFLQGDPENMIEYHLDYSQKGKIATLYINISQSSSVSAERIIDRGAAILAAREVLVADGYSLGISMVDATQEGGTRVEYIVPVVEPGGYVDLDTLAFTMAHPAFLRRFIFAVNEAEDIELRRQMGFVDQGGYGRPVDMISPLPENALLIDKGDGMDLQGNESISAFAQSVIDRVLNTLGDD